jgi:hypothetical protein
VNRQPTPNHRRNQTSGLSRMGLALTGERLADSLGFRLAGEVPNLPAALFSDDPIVWCEGNDLDTCQALHPRDLSRRNTLGRTCAEFGEGTFPPPVKSGVSGHGMG